MISITLRDSSPSSNQETECENGSISQTYKVVENRPSISIPELRIFLENLEILTVNDRIMLLDKDTITLIISRL